MNLFQQNDSKVFVQPIGYLNEITRTFREINTCHVMNGIFSVGLCFGKILIFT